MENALEPIFAALLHSYRTADDEWGLGEPAKLSSRELSQVLAVLGGDRIELAKVARSLAVSIDELDAAVRFHVRETLYRTGRDHYAVLGVEQDESRDAIRRRYQRLIGFLHPDRTVSQGDWELDFVRRLNTAYGVLKRPDKRRAYDLQLKAGRSSSAATPVNRPPKQSVPADQFKAAPGDVMYRVSLLQRHPKLAVWLSIFTFLALAMILTWVLSLDSGPKIKVASLDNDMGVEAPQSRKPSERLLGVMEVKPEGLQTTIEQHVVNKTNGADAIVDRGVDFQSADAWPEQARIPQVVEIPEQADSQNKLFEVDLDEVLPADANDGMQALATVGSTMKPHMELSKSTDDIEIKPVGSKSDRLDDSVPAENVSIDEPAKLPSDVSMTIKQPVAVNIESDSKPDRAPEYPDEHLQKVAQVVEKEKELRSESAKFFKKINPVSAPEKKVVPQVAEGLSVGATGFDGAEVFDLRLESFETRNAGYPKSKDSNSKGDARLQPEYMFMQFVSAYQAGNLRKLVNLFTLRPVTPHGKGRAKLKAAYARLFESTRNRRMEVGQLRVKASPDGQVFQARARVRVENQPIGVEKKALYQGEMVFYLVKKGNQLYIDEMLHDVRKRN